MNKLCYRIIFNRARGLLMVVADIARSRTGSSRTRRDKIPMRCCRLSPLSCAMLAAFAFVTSPGEAQAGIVADGQAPNNQQPNIVSSANGTPQINIQTPSEAGVSRNTYSQFDVDNKGAILNNSRHHVATQLGGMVAGNQWLAGGEAKVILNEVNSRDPSRLHGYIEVAGRQAQVVIANPSGISCNGCGFINANRATLTTGQAQMSNGQLTGYAVERGEIVVQGAGMDSSRQDYTDVIARSVKINAGIVAKALNVTAGRNRVDAAHQQIDTLAADGSARPQLAVDVARLGGMYANKIRLIGTEQGVGVANAGNIGAQAGSLVVTADGRIENSGNLHSSAGMNVASNTAINNSGALQAGDSASLTSTGDLHNGGSIAARNHLQTQSASLNSEPGSVLAAGVNQDGKLTGSGKLTLTTSGQLRAQGQNLAAGDFTARGQGVDVRHGSSSANNITLDAGQSDLLTGSGAQIAAQRQLTASSGKMLNNDGGSLSADKLSINAHDLSNQQGAITQLGSDSLQLSHRGNLNNLGGSLASNGKDLTIQSAIINNQDGKIVHAADGNLSLSSDRLNGAQGQILSNGHLSMTTGDTLLDGGVTLAQLITLTANSLSNRDGKILQTGSGTLSLTALNAVENQNGTLAAGGDIHLRAASLNNQQGQISAQDNGSLNVNLLNPLNNQQGVIQADGTVGIDTQGQQIDNRSGLLSAGKSLTLLSGELVNQAGQLRSGGDLQLHSHGHKLDNAQGGIISSFGNARLDVSELDNRGGQLQTVGNALLNAFQGLVNNTAGLIRSGATTTINAAQIVNRDSNTQNTGLEGQSVQLNSDSLDNTQGTLRANDLLAITTMQSLNNSQGLVSSADAISVSGGDTLKLSNSGGTLISGKDLQLRAASLAGDGRVLSQGAMTLNLQQGFVNQGDVIANGDLNFNVGGNVDNRALLKSGATLNLHSASLNNAAEGEISAGQNHIFTDGELTNRGLIDGSLTHIQSGTLTNTGSGRIYGDHIALQSGTLNNLAEGGTAATIAARERLDIGAQNINNSDHALIFSAGDAATGGQLNDIWQASGQASVFNNHSATLESVGNMTLNIGQINNFNDHLVTQEVVSEPSQHHEAVLQGATTRHDWDKVDTSYSNKYDVHDAIMPDGSVNNEFYEYQYQRTVTETQITESDPGQIIAGGNLTIDSDRINNYDSRMMAGGTLGVNPGAVLNNVASEGTKVTVDIGRQTHWYAKKSSNGLLGGTKTSQGKDTNRYRPAPMMQTFALATMVYQGHTQVNGSGTTIGGRATSELNQQADNAAVVTPPADHIVEIALPNQAANSVIRVTSPNTHLPDNSLFQLHGEVTSHYLIETDPRFTHQKQWLSSDYMQSALSQDPDRLDKRLGDGYYEQRLIREQIVDLTGQRYLAGYNNDGEQYKALMDAGVTFAKDYHLTLGVALTPAQMALLTSDMVWLVRQDVTLPDGSQQSVLVPQVYARVKKGDLDGSGALLSGNNLVLNTGRDLTNGGKIAGREVTQINADTLNNSGIIGANRVNLNALTDINNIGGTLQGGDALVAIAGRDINSSSTLAGDDSNRYLNRPAGIYVQNDNGALGLLAVNNINLTASQLDNSGNNSQTEIIAGHNLNLNTLTTTHSEKSDWGSDNYRHLTQTGDIGTQLNGGGSVALSAGHDLNAQAAAITAKDSVAMQAGHDINLTAGDSAYHLTEHSQQTVKGLLSGKSAETHDEVQSQSALGSSVSGNSVTMQAGHDLRVSASSVASTQDVSLLAGNDLNINTAGQSRQETHLREEEKTGLTGTSGIGFSYGKNALKTTDEGQSQSSAGSIVGSSRGNVNLTAGNALTVKGSEVLGGQDLNLSGKQVSILAADNQSVQTHTVEQKQSGLTLALSGAVGSAVNGAVTSASEASNASSGRLAALDGIKTALGGVQAYQGYQLGTAQGEDAKNLFGVNLSYGSQSSKSQQTQTSNQSQGSTLTAGNNLNIRATDADITVQGSQLQAGRDLGLAAARDVNLLSAQNTSLLEGKNESHGASVGVGINFGGDKNGLTLNASGNKGTGSENGNGVTHTETTLNAGHHLTISSGRDTTLTGAQVSGDSVTLDTARNLTLTSEQDSDNYDSKQQNASAGGSAGAGGPGGSFNLSRDKMHSTWDSVQEQTGIFAGKGGFDITTGGHTQLNGAVIGSTATADKNRLDTGTLGFADMDNRADYKVEHLSAGFSTGGSTGGQFLSNLGSTLLVGANGEGHDSSATQAAVSDGSIIIRDKNAQQQDVADLNRDVEHASQTLSPIFNKEKEQQRLQEAQKIGEIATQAMDIAATQGKIEATHAANDKIAGATQHDRDEALSDLKKQDPSKQYDSADIEKQVYQNFYNQALTESGFGTGGKVQQAIQAATAAVQGLAGGNIAQAMAGGAAPYLAEVIHKMTTDPATGSVDVQSNLMAHAVLGAVVAQTSGHSALAGAAGATTGEFIAQQLYPGIDRNQLNEEQKQTVSALGTLAAGLAGGLTGGSAADTVAGAQAGKNAVENNALGLPSGLQSYVQAVASWDQYAETNELTPEQKQAGLNKLAQGDMPEGANIPKVIVEAYKDGVLAAGAAYLGPAASAGKVVGGALIGAIANGSYQWFDMSQPGNENKSYDYLGTGSAAVTGGLAPGRGIWQNVGIATGGAIFTDGPDAGAVGGAAAGAWAGGMFGEYAPGIVNSVIGKELPGIVYDVIGSGGSEVVGGFVKDISNPQAADSNKGGK
ncbi:two-partner secretion domain-containing protein [Erwinia pyrifoliae]|uniref:Hemagglutinin repeat-containing protein n=1 Tax=Erwinia pyrifoliae TaxID=79967 RepID=A0ABY5X9W5_ERWPY|nr:hemagglutinin repeat-containing protein [Erwinia pyrifoliae]UWS34184.1 hemagglutinin repeat-containing protein [Erwinia pyrifoliae]